MRVNLGIVNPNVLVDLIALDRTSLSMEKGNTYRLIATVEPAQTTNKFLSWSSSNTNVAIVIDGMVFAKASGRTMIAVSSTDGSCINAYCSVAVN